MADPRILRAPEARQDFLEIWSYIAAQSAPAVADAVLARIYGASMSSPTLLTLAESARNSLAARAALLSART
jgi:hypothetical protein